MRLRKIPAINVVLFIIILGLLATLVVGMMLHIQSSDSPDDNYVESTYNSSLSNHYSDSLSHTFLGKLGTIEVKIYDSIENVSKHFIRCKISTNTEALSLNEVKDTVLTIMMEVFPWQTWNGEFTYRITDGLSMRVTSFPMHWKQLEIYREWSDD